jgi:excisionase family DNA binding protein
MVPPDFVALKEKLAKHLTTSELAFVLEAIDAPILLRKVGEVQRMLSCCRSKVYELGAEGKIEFVKDGRSSRITDVSVRKHVANLIDVARQGGASPAIESTAATSHHPN